MKAWRITLAACGIVLGLFGGFRLVTEVPVANLLVLGVWLVGAVVVHDGILSPAVVGVGWLVGRVVPPRARRYVQAALIVGGMITVVAIPLMLRAGQQPVSKAILRQDFGGNLTVLLGVVAAVTLALYAVRVARDHAKASSGVSQPQRGGPGPP